jgi:site-specific DNA-methyltransferase (adenine-specific)
MSASVRLEWLGKRAFSAPEGALQRIRAGDSESTLVHGDNLPAMQALSRRMGAAFTLVYLDPPFLTGRKHSHVERHRDERGNIVRLLKPGFDDRWDGLHHYLSELGDRLAVARSLLAPEGCLVVHVDTKTSHYAKVLCDEIFGPECFASEIVWRYRRWPSKTKNFQRVHDVLLRYVKDPDGPPRFRQMYEPLAESTRITWGDRKQRAVVGADGRRVRSSSTQEATPGVPLGDVWEIGIVAPVARERTGYPTQKPEALLGRLIEACTDPGDLILDPYSGSGTTLSVAARLGRRAVGIDSNKEALRVAKKRLRAQGVRPGEERVVSGPETAKARPKRRTALAS